MTERFSRWDSAGHLRSDDDIPAYLDACLEKGGSDLPFITRALGTAVRAKGIDQVAERSGLLPDRIGALLEPGSNPSFGEIPILINTLGLRLHADKAA